jgi:hypothetical protein
LEPGLAKRIISFVVLGGTLIIIVLLSYYGIGDNGYEDTWEEMEVPTHSIRSHSLGLHQQGETVRARVVIDEGSVKVLEGRVAIVQLLDSDNRASMEQGNGYVPLEEVRIDVKEASFPLSMMNGNEGSLEYKAHATDTYYLVVRNEDWWNLTVLLVADGEAQDTQLLIKVFVTAAIIATLVIFAWAYGRYFDVNVRQKLGLVGRPRGPGAKAAQEPRVPQVAAADMVLEAEGES